MLAFSMAGAVGSMTGIPLCIAALVVAKTKPDSLMLLGYEKAIRLSMILGVGGWVVAGAIGAAWWMMCARENRLREVTPMN